MAWAALGRWALGPRAQAIYKKSRTRAYEETGQTNGVGEAFRAGTTASLCPPQPTAVIEAGNSDALAPALSAVPRSHSETGSWHRNIWQGLACWLRPAQPLLEVPLCLPMQPSSLR